ncbi:MAG: beta-ketoacyl-ACP synthase II, partial [Bacilli bacterium]|nr:beta-ketoacyl-ACP synthase II [Bacilli bacterium]
MEKRVVVTGMGIVSCLGNDCEVAFNNAINGVNGINEITNFDTSELKVKIAAQVKEFDASKYMSKTEIRRQDLFSQYAVYASCEAFEDAKLKDINPLDIGVIIGSGIGGINTFAKDLEIGFNKGLHKIPPMFIPMIIPNMAAGNVAIKLNAQNHCTCVSTACSSGTNAIGDAYKWIAQGNAKVMIAGGSEASICPQGIAGFTSLQALSTSNDINRASIPFDKDRDGFVISEGAGILILEELEHAKARNAHIYCEVVGYGSTCDAYHITSPSGTGAINAMKLALKDANLKPKDIDYINAHGTGTPLNDKFETMAIKEVFKDCLNDLSISSTKSMTGHALGAAGAI